MKLYKFRSLGDCQSLRRAVEILDMGEFWCSNLWELNDPMEGIFYYNKDSTSNDHLNKIFSDKNNFVICSFSGECGFKNPAMWGYYANGFKGIAIEVEVDYIPQVYKVDYSTDLKEIINNTSNEPDAVNTLEQQLLQKILSTKLKPWEHENEFRFISERESQDRNSTGELRKIGRITAVYYGKPFADVTNGQAREEVSKLQKEYNLRINKLTETASRNYIKVNAVHVDQGEVQTTASAH